MGKKSNCGKNKRVSGEDTLKSGFIEPENQVNQTNPQSSEASYRPTLSAQLAFNPYLTDKFIRKTDKYLPSDTKSEVSTKHMGKLEEKGESITDLVGVLGKIKADAASETVGEMLEYIKTPIVIGEPQQSPAVGANVLGFIQKAKEKFVSLSASLKKSKAELAGSKQDYQDLSARYADYTEKYNDFLIALPDIFDALPESVREAHKEEISTPVSALNFVAQYLRGVHAGMVDLESAVKNGQADYVRVEQNMQRYASVVDCLIELASKPQYADRLSREDTKFLEEEKKGKSVVELPAYWRLLSMLSQFVDEDAAQIKSLQDKDTRLVGGLKNVAAKYAGMKVAHNTVQSDLEAITAQNKELVDKATKTSAFLKEAFDDFDAYIAKIEKSME